MCGHDRTPQIGDGVPHSALSVHTRAVEPSKPSWHEPTTDVPACTDDGQSALNAENDGDSCVQ